MPRTRDGREKFMKRVTDFVGRENKGKILVVLYRDDLSFTERDCLKYTKMKRPPPQPRSLEIAYIQSEFEKWVKLIQKKMCLGRRFVYIYTLSGQPILDHSKLKEDVYTIVISNQANFAGLSKV